MFMKALFWMRRELLPGILIGLVSVIVLLGAIEVGFRTQMPFGTISWPSRFDPSYGYTFVPGEEVRWTNYFDFWQATRANRFGFLDREPVPAGERTGNCHVAFIGDSFVEAAQVPIEKKVQVLTETMATGRAPELKITTSAFGYSGTGQLNQLPFYDVFASAEHPRVVVLVFVANDFANNSSVLESLRNGWDPDRSPRLFARRNADGKFEIQPIDPKWADYVLKRPITIAGLRTFLHTQLQARSLAYRWFFGKISILHPAVASFLSGGGSGPNLVSYFARQLQQRPAYASILEGWDPDKAPSLDGPFFNKDMAPIFEEAVAVTGFAFDQFWERAKRDGFELLILADYTLKPKNEDNWYFERLKNLADERGIPVIDHRKRIEHAGGKPEQAHFRFDGHWSELGHRWAAEAVTDYLVAHRELCAPPPGQSAAVK